MALTFKVFLDERRMNDNNIYPLKIRVTLNRNQKEFGLDLKLEKKYWDKKNEKIKPSHPNYKLIQLKISKKIAELQEKSLKIENSGESLTVQKVVQESTDTHKNLYFIMFAKQQIKIMQNVGRIGNSQAYQCAISKLKSYIGSTDIRFQDIDYKLLENFTNNMLNEGLKVNAIACYMREIRAIYNKAIKMELVDIKYYPFNKFKIKTEKTINRALTLEEIRAIVNIDESKLKGLETYHKLFLLSFCLIGINYADLLTLKFESLVNNRVIFHRKKTKKVYSIKLTAQAKQFIVEFKNVNRPLRQFKTKLN